MDFLTSSTLKEGALVLLLGTVLVGFIQTCRSVLPRYFSTVSRLPGPPAKSLLFGDLLRIGAESADRTQQWLREYGRTFRLYGPLMVGASIRRTATLTAHQRPNQEPRVFTTDLRAINHVLTHSMDYYKARENRIGLNRFLGDGKPSIPQLTLCTVTNSTPRCSRCRRSVSIDLPPSAVSILRCCDPGPRHKQQVR